MTRSGSLQYTVGGQNPACTDNTPPCTFSFRLPAVTLFSVPFGRKRVFSFLGRLTIVCHPRLVRARSKRRSFCAACFMCLFLLWQIMAKKAAVRQTTAKQLFHAIKKNRRCPLWTPSVFVPITNYFFFLKGLGSGFFGWSAARSVASAAARSRAGGLYR